MLRITHFHATFTVRHRDWHPRTGHAVQEQRIALLHFDQTETGFETLRFVAHEARPQFSTRDQVTQIRHHLTTVTHAQREGAVTVEETLELITGHVIKQ